VVEREFIDAGWTTMFFPPNMTHILQPMDLVVNSVVKSAMRRQRVQLLMDYFTDYKNRYLRATLQPEQVHPIFDPPSPTLIEGIIAMYAMREQSLLNDKFRNSVKRVFQSVGLAPIVSENDPQGTFVTYRGESTPGTIRKEFFEK
jgi:hypothetical protein